MQIQLPTKVRRNAACGIALILWLFQIAPAPAAGLKDLPPLSEAPDSPQLVGKFVWADLVTDDVPGAKRFYGRLFGWTFGEVGAYTIATNGDEAVCGMFHRERPHDRPAAARWFGYISVADVKAAKESVVSAGGHVLSPPHFAPKRGEQAVFADPEGAVFGVVHSSSGDPPDYLAEPGDWIWITLLSRNAAAAADFYLKVGGYEIWPSAGTGHLSDYVLASEGYARATIRTPAGTNPPVEPTWLLFVRVTNVTESVTLARQLGGQVRIEPRPDLARGRVAVITDPTGADIGILEWTSPKRKGGP